MSEEKDLELSYTINFLGKNLKDYDDLSLAARDILQKVLHCGTCDLHLHTVNSDGRDSVGEILKAAMDNGLHAIAITDYDTMVGVETMRIIVDKMLQLGIKIPHFIPGIEISASFGDIKQNLLAYFPLDGTGMMYSFLEDQRQRRRSRNIKMCECLQANGLPITIEDLEAEGPYIVGRLHAANLLIRMGIVMTQAEAFYVWLDKGRPAYVPYDPPQLVDCIKLVREANGVPVLSKPFMYGWMELSDEEIVNRLTYLKEQGLLGVEVVFSEMDEHSMDRLATATKKVGLLTTSGSGYSGYYRTNADMFSDKLDFSRWIS